MRLGGGFRVLRAIDGAENLDEQIADDRVGPGRRGIVADGDVFGDREIAALQHYFNGKSHEVLLILPAWWALVEKRADAFVGVARAHQFIQV